MDVFLGIFQLGPLEITLVALAALLLFGKRLPELAKSLGKGVTEFKKGLSGVVDDVQTPIEDSGKNEGNGEDEKTEEKSPEG